MDVPPLPPIEHSETIPKMNEIVLLTDLTKLNAVLSKGGLSNG